MLKNIAPDKWKHFYVGIIMGVVLQVIGCWLLPGNLTLAAIIVSAIIIFISYGFELFSLITGMGHYEFKDAVASVIGGAVGLGAVLLIAAGWNQLSAFN